MHPVPRIAEAESLPQFAARETRRFRAKLCTRTRGLSLSGELGAKDTVWSSFLFWNFDETEG